MVKQVDHLDIHLSLYRPPVGRGYVELPDFIKGKKAVLNIQNKDNKCFLWCILAALHPVEREKNPKRVSKYEPYEHELNLGGLSLPMQIGDVKKFEKLNQLSINVYGIEGKSIIPHPSIHYKVRACYAHQIASV